MKPIKEEVELYLAEDGKRFFSKDECVKYENDVLSKLKNIRYFRYFTSPDLNETGLFYKWNYAAVYLAGYSNCYKEVLMQYLFDKHNSSILSCGVQGYGVTMAWDIAEITKDEYFMRKNNRWGGSDVESDQIFLSREPIDGYPENIDVISKYSKKD